MLGKINGILSSEGALGKKALYAHISSALETEHRVLSDSDGALLIHTPENDAYIAEGSDTEALARMLEDVCALRFRTTSKELAEALREKYIYFEECVQCLLPDKNGICCDNKGFTLKAPDKIQTERITESYGKTHSEEVYRAVRENHLWLLEKGVLTAGYGGIHSDRSIGFLYIAPGYRGQGLGKVLLLEIARRAEGTVYSQILSDNGVSLNMHKKCGFCASEDKLYWLYGKKA